MNCSCLVAKGRVNRTARSEQRLTILLIATAPSGAASRRPHFGAPIAAWVQESFRPENRDADPPVVWRLPRKNDPAGFSSMTRPDSVPKRFNDRRRASRFAHRRRGR
jgi:hypothetical protein